MAARGDDGRGSRTRAVLGAGLTTAALAAAALALDPSTVPEAAAFAPVVAPPQAPDGLPPPLGGVAIKMGDRNWVNGQRVDLDGYYSHASLDELVDYYAAALSATAGERVPVRRMELGAITYLSAMGGAGAIRSVMLSPQSDGTILVVPSISRGPALPGGEASALGIPLPESAQALSTMEMEDPGRRGAAAHYLDPRPVDEAAREMEARLREAGLSPETLSNVPITEEGTRLLRYKSVSGEEVQVGFHPLGEAGTMVYVLRSKDRVTALR